MLTVHISVNGVPVAMATAFNISDLADKSDYRVYTSQSASKELGIEAQGKAGYIREHDRRQSAWALVEKIARIAMEE